MAAGGRWMRLGVDGGVTFKQEAERLYITLLCALVMDELQALISMSDYLITAKQASFPWRDVVSPLHSAILQANATVLITIGYFTHRKIHF